MLGDVIRREREARGWSQEELAKRTGYNGKSTICRIEKNERDIPRKKIQDFANAFGMSAGELLTQDFVAETPETQTIIIEYHKLNDENKKRLMHYIEFLKVNQDEEW